ncbi:MAG: LicD family protein, partial [Lachnospiraceae bacterium]|nr:LicD family protein [Lachnospiraceae bacterium]
MTFDNSFFEEEERDGFVIEPMMKRAWAAILEVYEVIRDVCDKNGIHFYACGGTLLGAIRHKGFIPWDDDMDLCMIRDDYMRFLEVAPTALPKGFVLAGMYSPEKRLWLANQTMQMRVIADEEYFSLPSYMNRFHGYPFPRIGIDIFPYDLVDENYALIHDRHEIYHYTHLLVRAWDSFVKDGTLKKRISELERITERHINISDKDLARKQIAQIGDSFASDASRENAVHLCNITGTIFNNGFPQTSEYKSIIDNWVRYEWYGDGVDLPFENTSMRVGRDYLKIVEK